jgi:hypothetical protein
MRRLPTFAAGLGLLTVALCVPDAFSGDPQPTPAKPAPPPKAEAKPPLQVKVFRLTKAEPTAVAGALESLLGPTDEVKVEPMPGGGPLPPMGGGMLGIGGGFGGVPAGPPLWRLTVNERAKAVIVRGSARHLAIAADVVAVLDRAPNAPLPKTQTLQAFELKHAAASDLTQVIEALAFEDVSFSAAAEKLLLVIAPPDEQKVIADLVKELDVESKPDPDKK